MARHAVRIRNGEIVSVLDFLRIYATRSSILLFKMLPGSLHTLCYSARLGHNLAVCSCQLAGRLMFSHHTRTSPIGAIDINFYRTRIGMAVEERVGMVVVR